MEAILIRERYKMIRVLKTGENYACAEAVDILDREKPSCLLNVYEGPLLRVYLSCLSHFSNFSDPSNPSGSKSPPWKEVFVEGESLVLVFALREGQKIDQVFYRGSRHTWQERLCLAEALLHEALNMADFPPQMSCAALLSENVLVNTAEKQVQMRFLLPPLEDVNPRETVYLACDQLRKILLPRFASPQEELDFLDELDQGTCLNVVQLYGLWRRRKPEIQAAYERLDKKNIFQRTFLLIWKEIKRVWRSWRSRRR